MTGFLCRFFLFSIICFLSAGYLNTTALAQASQKARIVAVEVAPIQVQPVQKVLEAVGTSRANQSVEIKVLSSGIVREILFNEGQQVKRGDVLVRLDDDIERADLAEAKARLVEARQALERSRSLRKRDAVAASSVEKLVAELEIARAEQDRAARKLADRALIAPFDGRIGFSDIEIGSYLQTNQSVATLDDLSRLLVDFYLSEKRYAQVKVGTPLRADAAAFADQVFDGQIIAIDTRINAQTRSFKVRAVIDNKQGLLPAGMFMHLSLYLGEGEEGLVAPEEAVITNGSQTSLFVVVQEGNENRVEQRTVQLGQRLYGLVQILNGVAAGEQVVVRGIQKVRHGALVKVKAAAPSLGVK